MTDAIKPPSGRRAAWRLDLADERLRGRVEAPRFVTGTAATVVSAVSAVRKRPDQTLGLETEFLFGETVKVFDTADSWAWVQADIDDYVGYIRADDITAQAPEPTHVVRALATFLYPQPDFKTVPLKHLSIGSRIAVLETRERFSALATGGFVLHHHIAPLSQPARDFVDIAERFVGAPYLWGGRSRLGVDCSGLLQLAMQAAGLTCPRDSDMQRAEVGVAIEVPPLLAAADPTDQDVEGLRRGDLLFWPGHVGIMTDGHMVLHANGHHMSTVIEPALEAAIRIKRQTGDAVATVRRPDQLGA